jgi:hypothetical protein
MLAPPPPPGAPVHHTLCWPVVWCTSGMTYGVYCGCCLASALANSLGDSFNIFLNQFGGCLNGEGAGILLQTGSAHDGADWCCSFDIV